MTIDLPKAVQEHLQRVTNLAQEAAEDPEQSYAARASAMTAVTTMLKELTKTQENLINMERLQRTEQTIIDTVKGLLDEAQLDQFIRILDERLKAIQ